MREVVFYLLGFGTAAAFFYHVIVWISREAIKLLGSWFDKAL